MTADILVGPIFQVVAAVELGPLEHLQESATTLVSLLFKSYRYLILVIIVFMVTSCTAVFFVKYMSEWDMVQQNK